ncbi:hypothetical protein D910_11605 [Dendroctonus ponderosae]|uniref:SAM domain-containing protein n=1 Tax=Dendroctonus ponderosae TaxID=77166 RepID=U4UJR9_DENPD|nr:hypothetical protein D910_11605 [Dendroctonus ponderosae]KAH1008763.1 hypothetical protein HUJ05_009291 [Dendroctonus ponderosae]
MDLLETVLRSCQAEQYINNFKDHRIDTYILKLLVEEDLELIGIDDEETRVRVLQHFANLQIPTEKKRDITVNHQFLGLVLTQIKVQLMKHFANLTFALRKTDVDLCYIKINPAIVCLENCISSFEHQVEDLERNILKPKSSRNSNRALLLCGTLATSMLFLFAFARYTKWASPY